MVTLPTPPVDTIIKPGTRLAVFGRSGSGKSYLQKWHMFRSRMRWVVLDTKHDSGYSAMKPLAGLIGMGKLAKVWQDQQIVVVRPKPNENKMEFLDAYLAELHDAFDNFGTCIDEAYQVSNANNPGAGMIGLITRGRDRKQSVIIGSQRPARVPMFCFSEANAFCVMSLTMAADRKRVYENTGQSVFLENSLPPRSWFYYDVASNRLVRYGAVTIT